MGAGQVALTLLLAGGCPPARLAVAGAGEGIAAAVGTALAGELAELPPVVGVAGAVPTRWVAAPVGVARAAPLAVRAPVLLRAGCEGKEMVRMGGDEEASQPAEHLGWQRGWRGLSPGKNTHQSCSLLRRSQAYKGKPRVSHTPRPLRRRLPPRTALSAAGQMHQYTAAPLSSHPAVTPATTWPPPVEAAFPEKPPSHVLLHPSS